MENEKIYNSESFGLLDISKRTGHSKDLFGSNIETSATIVLRVKGAELCRMLHKDWIHSKETIVEIEMTANQWAEAISIGMNTSGVPCTIKRKAGKSIKYESPYTLKEIYELEENEHFQKIGTDTSNLLKDMHELCIKKGTISKTEMKTLTDKMHQLNMNVNSNLPFIRDSFAEGMDKVVTEAKNEIVNFAEKENLIGIEKQLLEINHGS